jgi:hypothetical protein
MSNKSVSNFLEEEAPEATESFTGKDGKPRRGYISNLGHELVSKVETFLDQNDWADFEVYKKEPNKQKEGFKYTKFSLRDLKRGTHRRRITTWLKERNK